MKQEKTLLYERLTNPVMKLTRANQKIADYLLRNYPSCMLKNASEMASELAVNVSTVTRFFQKIGYKSIREAQNEFKEDYDFLISSPLDRFQQTRSTLGREGLFQEVLDMDAINIRNTFAGISRQDLEKFLNILKLSRQIFIFSERSKTFALAYYFYAQLKFILPGIQFLRADKMIIADSLSKISKQDTLIIFSFRRYPILHQLVAKVFRKWSGKIVTLTDSPISPIAKLADLVLLVETNSVSPFDSYTAGFSLLNALLGELSREYASSLASNYERIEETYKDLEIF
ncbi:MAG: MurR/RpiR family transcriptional regulator [Pseudomonadota bacterium]